MKNKLTNDEIESVLLEKYPKSKIISINRIQEKTRKRIVVDYICGQCGARNVSAYDNIKKQKGCKTCGLSKRKSTTKYNVDIVEKELTIRGFEWLNKSEYVDANSMIKTKCIECNTVSTSNITSRIKGNRKCSQCLGLARKTIDEVCNEINNLDKDYIVLSDKYLNAHSLLNVKHLECGNVFNVTRANFRKGRRCPYCIKYKGEEKIKEILNKMDINFIQQYSFEGCKYKNTLKFDFAVFTKNSTILIEYNGIQHYKPVEHFGGENTFREQVVRDNIKRDYCLKNSFKLIEIDYKSFSDIESILRRELR